MSALLSALAFAALSGSATVSDRTEVRLRSSAFPSTSVVDIESTPRVALALGARRWEFNLAWTPRLILIGLGGSTQADAVNAGELRFHLRGRRAAFTLTESAAVGRQSVDSLALSPSQGAAASSDLLRARGSFDYLASSTTARLTLTPSRRLRLSAAASYSMSGGADALSRLVMPFAREVRGEIGAAYQPSRRDQLTTTVTVSRIQFSPGARDLLLQGIETWQHALSRSVTWTLSAGVAARLGPARPFFPGPYRLGPPALAIVLSPPLVNSPVPFDTSVLSPGPSPLLNSPVPFDTSVLGPAPLLGSPSPFIGLYGADKLTFDPIVEAALNARSVPLRVDLRLSARLTPVIDRLNGIINQRLQYAGLLDWQATRALSLRAQLGAAHTVAHRDPAAGLAYGSFTAMIKITRAVSLDGGLRTFWLAGGTPVQWALFTGLTFSPPRVTF